MAALECAIAKRKPPPGLVHHSDRGVQYASGDYVTILRKHQMIPSMSRPANPYDKDYASHCTSWVPCATTWFERRLDSFTPCAFRGGLLPGCSNRQSFLSLQA
jgi:putative transposase